MRDLVQSGEFVEVFVSTPLEVASNVTEGPLLQAARGRDQNFTVHHLAYEAPEAAEIVIYSRALVERLLKVIVYL